MKKELFMNRIIYDEKNGEFRHYTDEEVTIQKIKKGKGKDKSEMTDVKFIRTKLENP